MTAEHLGDQVAAWVDEHLVDEGTLDDWQRDLLRLTYNQLHRSDQHARRCRELLKVRHRYTLWWPGAVEVLWVTGC